MSGFMFSFKTSQFVALQRSQLYGPTEFLASCGGLLGLFLGFSFMSVVELIYFLTIRLICDLQKWRHQKI
jgi:acid-sensing ion channel, other